MPQGIILEQHLLPPFEQPEVTATGHILSVHLSQPLELEHRCNSSWQSDTLQQRDLCLTPAGANFTARWQDTAESIVIQLDELWLRNIAGEIGANDAWELRIERGKQDDLVYALAVGLRNEVANGYQTGRLYFDSLLHTLGVHLIILKPTLVEYKRRKKA